MKEKSKREDGKGGHGRSKDIDRGVRLVSPDQAATLRKRTHLADAQVALFFIPLAAQQPNDLSFGQVAGHVEGFECEYNTHGQGRPTWVLPQQTRGLCLSRAAPRSYL